MIVDILLQLMAKINYYKLPMVAHNYLNKLFSHSGVNLVWHVYMHNW